MADKAPVTEAKPASGETAAPTPPAPPRRGPGHRGADVRDTVAEMAARAQEISQEAGSKMAAAMKDVINAAAGLAGFAIESARDLVQYMVRRGQMTQEEADKLIREAEEASSKRRPLAPPPPRSAPGTPTGTSAAAPKAPAPAAPPRSAAPKQAAKAPAAKTPARAPAKPATKPGKPAAKKPAAKKPAARSAKPASKTKAKPAAKKK